MDRGLVRLFVAAALLLANTVASALTPLTGTIDVDNYATSNKNLRNARVAMANDGSFVVAYEVEWTTTDTDLRVARFGADGQRLVGPLVVDGAAGHQTDPQPAILPDGGFAVAYTNASGDYVVKRWTATGSIRAGTTIIDSLMPVAGTRMAFAVNGIGTELLAWWNAYTDTSGSWYELRSQTTSGTVQTIWRLAASSSTSLSTRPLQVTATDEFRLDVSYTAGSGSISYFQEKVARLNAAGGGASLVDAPYTSGLRTTVLPDERVAWGYSTPDPDDASYEFLTLVVWSPASTESFHVVHLPFYTNLETRIEALAADLTGRITVLWSRTATGYNEADLFLTRVTSDFETEPGRTIPLGRTASTAGVADASLGLDSDGDFVATWRALSTPSHVMAMKVRGGERVDLALTQVEDADPAPASGPVEYRLNVRNRHPYAGAALAAKAVGGASRVSLVDILPEGSTLQSVSGTGWTCTQDAGRVLCDHPGVIGPQASSTVSLSILPPASASGGVIFNDAAVFAEQLDPDPDNNGEVEATHVSCGEGSVSFVLPAGQTKYSVAETAGQQDVVVTRAGGCGAASVTLSTRDYSASAIGGDYEPVSVTLNWADGETGTRTVPVTILDDNLDESREHLRVVLGSPVGVGIGTGEALVAIEDDDVAPVVRFERAFTSVGESDGAATVALVLSAVSGRDVRVQLSASASGNDAASPDTDYELGSTAITIPAGWTRLEVPVGIDADAIDEVDEKLTLTIVDAANARLGRVTTNGVTIVDDDTARVSFAQAASSVAESVASKSVSVVLSTPASRAITVPLTFAGTATAPGDYTAPSSITFTAGQVSRSVAVSIVNDTAVEPDETVAISLGTPSFGALGTQTTHTVTITNDD